MPPQLKHRTPSVQAVDKDGLLYKAQVVLYLISKFPFQI